MNSQGFEYPHSKHDEQSILGRMIGNPRILDEITLRPEDFFDEAHQTIFRAAKAITSGGGNLNPATLREHLLRSGKMEDVGGMPYITRLVTDTVGTDHYVVDCARIVREKAVARAMIDFGFSVQSITGDSSLDIETKKARLNKLFTSLEDGTADGADQWLADHVEELADKIQAGEFKPRQGIKTPFSTLNKITGGLPPGLIVVAGRPGDGKSVSALEFVLNAASKAKIVPALVTMEMAADEVARRALARWSGIDQDQWGRLEEQERRRVMDAASDLISTRVIIEDRGQLKVNEIVSKMRRWHRRHGCGLVVVDYLQLLNPDSTGETRAREVGIITRQMKIISLELKIPVVLLSQLNRASDGKPSLKNLRESGAIEQDADVVLALWREDEEQPTSAKDRLAQRMKGQAPSVSKPSSGPEDVTLSVLKNRNGPAGRDIRLLFWGSIFKFAEKAPEYHADEADAFAAAENQARASGFQDGFGFEGETNYAG